MTSIFHRALGDDFERLHPMLQKRFGFTSDDGIGCVGRGTMLELERGPWWTVPFLRIGTARHILFPETGRDVPFTIENYAYVDTFGRETLTFVRTFDIRPHRRRRFDATMVYDDESGHIVDYLGTHQHLAVTIEAAVEADGSLRLRATDQHFYEGAVGFRFPMTFSGFADVRESYDEDRELFTIDVEVANARFGRLFHYRGEFTCDFPQVTRPPSAALPLREEPRH
jgi:hypothetical protein